MSNYHKEILSYFTRLDIEGLKLYLKDGYSYQDTTKEIFLEKIEEIFQSLKTTGDTELIICKGTCCSEECSNAGKTGYLMIGNQSRSHISLIFELEHDDIKDIYQCHFMNTNKDAGELKRSLYIRLGKDDDVSFRKDLSYYIKVNEATQAYSELHTTPTSVITFLELCYWLDKHYFLNEKIGAYTVFEPLMRWTPFTESYAYFSKWREYIEANLTQIEEANKCLLKIQDIEEKLIEWVLKFDKLFDEAPFEMMYMAIRSNEVYTIEGKENIHFIGHEFQQTFDFAENHQTHQKQLLKKFNTLTKEETRLIFNESQINQLHSDVFKLSYHLEQRKLAKELGIEIPFNIENDI
jgi:hypothetical protein